MYGFSSCYELHVPDRGMISCTMLGSDDVRLLISGESATTCEVSLGYDALKELTEQATAALAEAEAKADEEQAGEERTD